MTEVWDLAKEMSPWSVGLIGKDLVVFEDASLMLDLVNRKALLAEEEVDDDTFRATVKDSCLPTPGRLFTEPECGILLHVGGTVKMPRDVEHQRSIQKSELLTWADKLPSFILLLNHCRDEIIWWDPGSFDAKLAHVDRLWLESKTGLKEAVAKEMESSDGALFLKLVAKNVFNADLNTSEIRPMLVAMIPTDCSPKLPPKQTAVAPPLTGSVFLSVFKVDTGAVNLAKVLATAMKLWRRAHWPAHHFRLAAMSGETALSLQRVLHNQRVREREEMRVFVCLNSLDSQSERKSSGVRKNVEQRWIARLREGLVLNFQALYGVGADYAEDKSSIIGKSNSSAVLCLFSWDFVFHKQCEVELASLWPNCEQLGAQNSFHVLPEINKTMTEADWEKVKWQY